MAKIATNVHIGAYEFYESMDSREKKEMAKYMTDDFNIIELIESQEDKQAFYKEFAYQVANSDSLNLEYLIEELKYWSNK